MTPGMPGAGIGGIFYLVSAVLMPFRELHRTARRRSSLGRWRGIGRQFSIALTIIGSVWATGWLIGLFLQPERGAVASGGSSPSSSSAELVKVGNVLGVGPLVAALIALASVVTIVEVVSLARRALRRRRVAPLRSADGLEEADLPTAA